MYAIMTYTRHVHMDNGHSRVYFESVTFTGRVTKAHTDKILATLKNEKYFIPEQVGLPKPGPVGHMVKQCCDRAAHCVEDVCDDCEYNPREIGQVWCELQSFENCDESLAAIVDPDKIARTVTQMVNAFWKASENNWGQDPEKESDPHA